MGAGDLDRVHVYTLTIMYAATCTGAEFGPALNFSTMNSQLPSIRTKTPQLSLFFAFESAKKNPALFMPLYMVAH